MKMLCCMYNYISPMHTSRTSSFLHKDQTPVKTQDHCERHLYQTQPNMHLSQLLISDSDLLQLHSKEQNISKYRGTVTQKLLISYSGTSQSPFIFTILKKI